MKKQFFFIASSLLLLTVSSCQNKALYSCNPEIDKWTRSHLAYIHNMTYDDFLAYNNDINLQKSIYAAMKTEQKIELWKSKITAVLKLPWNEKERTHIESLLAIIEKKPYFFDSALHKNNADEIDLFSYNWINHAKEELGWEDEIYAVGVTLNSIVMKDGQIVVIENYANDTSTIKTRSEYACNCSYNVGCSPKYTCIDHPCQIVSNCGVLGLSDCTGMCGRDI